MALTRRPRHGDVVQFKNPYGTVNITVGFATDDGLARDDNGVIIFAWGFNNDTELSSDHETDPRNSWGLNSFATLIEEGPDVPDERSSLDLLYDGSPYAPKGISE